MADFDYADGRLAKGLVISTPRFVAAVHGGAADYTRAAIGEARIAAGLDAMQSALLAARRVLADGGAALDAVIAAVRVLEDAEALNAGRGAALTTAGEAELDAAVCDGRTRAVGAVAAVRTVRHPVDAARAVLDDGRHVLLVGDGAERLAHDRGVERVDPSWFVTDAQREALARPPVDRGTVGVVALDMDGHLAAATSTGGISGQAPGRVGDSPVLGAGTWADDRTLAVSATGDGEAFIRAVFAHHAHLSMLWEGVGVAQACASAFDEVGRLGGVGGCIAVTAAGEVVMPFTTRAMFRGWIGADNGPFVGVEPGECPEPPPPVNR